ncbi:uncharacterized protein [Elaeis guineensis]|uniref:uncharacterized protein n=1 Tax=Elaeis guineensis var. tenera TaxID=51953 RepID=UPI003C6D3D22
MTIISTGHKKVMVHLRFVSFVVGLLLSLAVLGDSLALADRGMVTLTHDDGILKSDRELEDSTKMVDATGNMRVRGRKMVKEVKGTMKTGKAKSSLNKSCGSSNAKDSSSTTLQSGPLACLGMKTEGNALEPPNYSQIKSQVMETSSSTHAILGSLEVSELSHDQSQTDETQMLLAATSEIFEMLVKDYHQKAHRRPPIFNNDLPLRSTDVKP